MHSRQRLFLTLFLAQGACLAMGFWIRGEMVTAFRNAAPGNTESLHGIGRTDSRWETTIAANCLAFVGTWGLLTSVTGLLFLREHNARPARRPPQTEESVIPCLAIYHEADESIPGDLEQVALECDGEQRAVAAPARESSRRCAREQTVPLAN